MDKVVHFEVPADNLERAKNFYQTVFNWQLQDMPEMNYVIARSTEVDEKQMPATAGAINGGMFKRGPNNPAQGPTFAIAVKSIDESVEKIKALGGEIVKEKTPVGTMGFIAYFKDPEGNVLSLWQNA